MNPKNILTFLTIAYLLAITVSCDEDSKETNEPINSTTVFRTVDFMEYTSLNRIINDESFASADAIFLSYIQPDQVLNKITPSEISKSQVFGYFNYPSKVDNLTFNGKDLKMYVADIQAISFKFPTSFTIEYNHGDDGDWSARMKDGSTVEASFPFCKSIHQAFLDVDGVMHLDEAYYLYWTQSDDDSELWLDFEFKASNSISTLEVEGYKLEDDGKFLIPKNDLKKFGIDTSGKLTMKFFRMKKSVSNFGYVEGQNDRTLVMYSVNEAKINLDVTE